VLLWAGTFLGLGFLFSAQLEQVAHFAHQIGIALVVLVVCGGLAGYLLRKYVRRQRFLRQLRMARITPEELKQKLDAGEEVAIVDLRHPLDFLPEPYLIPGAIRMTMEELAHLHEAIPRDRDVVLYCTCPNEATKRNDRVTPMSTWGYARASTGGRVLRLASTWIPSRFPIRTDPTSKENRQLCAQSYDPQLKTVVTRNEIPGRISFLSRCETEVGLTNH